MKSRLLRTLYDRAARGLPFLGKPGIEPPADTSPPPEQDHPEQGSPLREVEEDERVDRLINRYVVLSGATGFAFGLPGYAAMPVTIPSNVAATLLLQFHLCATLAAMGGRDPRDEAVRERSIQCILNSRELEILSGEDENDSETSALSNQIASKISERAARLLGELATEWIQHALRRTARSSGYLRPRNLPLLGGAFGAINDGASTRAVGSRAQHAFLTSPADPASDA